MFRVILFFALLGATALGLSWMADRPGSVTMNWLGYEIETSVMAVVISLTAAFVGSLLAWSILRGLFTAPGKFSDRLRLRREKKGMEALSRGMIAVSAGNAVVAKKCANQAERVLDNRAMTAMLKAQAAQLSGDRITARKSFEAMLDTPETELMGLKGLYEEALREKETEAARQFAERAVRLNPKLDWSTTGLLDIQSRAGDWMGALQTLRLVKKNGDVDTRGAKRKRGVLLAARAVELEDEAMDEALKLALEAHKLAPDLVPAADVAGRILASKGNTSKAAKVITRTWEISPHPDLALTYSYARPGDSPRDRLRRIKLLARRTPNNIEGPIAIATAAIESHDWDEARDALKPLLEKRATERVCKLMARIEGGEFGDKGRVREWLIRAGQAQRDPVWMADGFISDRWLPVSPITGELDAFTWTVPADLPGRSRAVTEITMEDYIPLVAPGGAALAAGVDGSTDGDEESSGDGDDTTSRDIVPLTPVEPDMPETPETTATDAEDPDGGETEEVIEAEPVHEVKEPHVPPQKAAAMTPPKDFGPTGAERPAPQPEIYIPPRSPDDPGPEPNGDDGPRPRMPLRYRYTS